MIDEKPMINPHAQIKERTSLAIMYAEDGAFNAGARVLRDLAREMENHSTWANAPIHAAQKGEKP